MHSPEPLLDMLTSRLAQAYLLVGPRAAAFARSFIAKIYCPLGCGRCAHCHKLQTGTHPDLFWVSKAGKRVSIEQIRELQHQALYAPLEAPQKIYVIESLEDLSLEAANSLLKILESPPAFLIFILLARSQNVLPTLLSRCQVIKLPKPSRAAIATELRARGWTPPAIEYLLSVTKGDSLPNELDPSQDILAERDQLRQKLSCASDNDLWSFVASEDIFTRREANLEVLRRLRRWNAAQVLSAAGALGGCPPAALQSFIEEATYWCGDLLAGESRAAYYNGDCAAELSALKADSLSLAEALRALEKAPWQWQRQNANLQLLLESLLFKLRAALV